MCEKHMQQQEKHRDKLNAENPARYHCKHCKFRFHEVGRQATEIMPGMEAQINLQHPFTCEECRIIEHHVKKIVYKSYSQNQQDGSLPEYNQYLTNPAKLPFNNEGCYVNSSLYREHVRQTIEHMKQDGGKQMLALTSKSIFKCYCYYCSRYPDFKPMIEMTEAEITAAIEQEMAETKFDFSREITRCCYLWRYYNSHIASTKHPNTHSLLETVFLTNEQFKEISLNGGWPTIPSDSEESEMEIEESEQDGRQHQTINAMQKSRKRKRTMIKQNPLTEPNTILLDPENLKVKRQKVEKSAEKDQISINMNSKGSTENITLASYYLSPTPPQINSIQTNNNSKSNSNNNSKSIKMQKCELCLVLISSENKQKTCEKCK